MRKQMKFYIHGHLKTKKTVLENMLAMTLYASAQGDSQTVTVDLTA